MGLQLPWAIEMMGIECPTAYLRLNRLVRQSVPDETGLMVLGDTLFAEFLVYASEEARKSRRDHVGNVAVQVEGADWSSDLAAQAYSALKARFPNGFDVL